MAFSLTKFRAHAVPFEGVVKKRGYQRLVFEITALVTDVDMDLGDLDGTFWSAVDDTAMGAAVLARLTNQIQPQLANLLAVRSEQLIDRIQAATASGTAYEIAVEGHLPNLTFAASNGETAWVIEVICELADGIEPFNCEYSV